MKKRIILQLSSLLIFSTILLFITEKCNVRVYRYINYEILNLFFIAITVLFPIGMSIATSIDLSSVVNKKERIKFVSNLRQYVKSFCFYFVIDCIAMLTIVILKQIEMEQYFLHLIYLFSITAILFSVFYFLHNFMQIFKFKRDLEEMIFKELHED